MAIGLSYRKNEMTRNKKLQLNTISSLLNQIITLVCGFILPRYILSYYGSTVNGLVSSVQQLLGLISFCELGVGAVVQSALYKPLADNDGMLTSKILISARKFFDKVGIILSVYVVLLAAFFPLSQRDDFDYISTMFLVLAMSISYFAQYFFGVRDQLLVNADQRSYIQLFYQSLTVIINTVLSVVIIKCGASIQIVKLITSLVYLIRPIGLAIYVKRNYKIDYSLKLTEEPIKQKWNGLAQHFATVVLQNTDTVVLTFFSTLINVSIYNVYNLVLTGVQKIVSSLTSGAQSLFGNLLARGEMELLGETFDCVEWLFHVVTVLAFTMTGVLIVPFVQIYTKKIIDANYIVPLFAALLTCATALYCLRSPYTITVLAAGHYKQTQNSAIIEMILNVVISIGLVFWLGLIGVAIGTMISVTYRTVYFALYLRKNILKRRFTLFVKHILVDIVTVVCMVAATFWIKLSAVNYFAWIIMALECGGICLAVLIIINLIFYRKTLKNVIQLFLRRHKAENKTEE